MPLVVLDGIDGSGKSTVVATLAALCSTLRERKQLRFKDVHTVHFPAYFTPIGQVLRRYLHSPPANQFLFSLLFEVNRFEQLNVLEESIRPDVLVICDRYFMSGWVYSQARGSTDRQIRVLRDIDAELPKPDLVFILDLDPLLAAKRMQEKDRDVLESDVEFQSSVREIFKRYAKLEGWSLIDASKPERATREIFKIIKERL
jgi:dTMP kinase